MRRGPKYLDKIRFTMPNKPITAKTLPRLGLISSHPNPLFPIQISATMAAVSLAPVFPRAYRSPALNEQCRFFRQCDALRPAVHCSPVNFSERKLRIVAFAVSGNAEESFKKTIEIDRLIDLLRDANEKELPQLVAENILAFNEGFWIRLAARTDTCKSDDDKKDYEELAALVMCVVDRIVHKTKEKIESATDVLKEILKPVVDGVEEICWPPKDPEALNIMKKELNQREQEGQLDEGFLSEVSAQLRQAKEDGDKPGLEAMLQKVLQLYASQSLSKRSYSKKGNEVLRDEQLLEIIIAAPQEEWNKILIDGMTIGKGDIPPERVDAVIKKRIERTLIRTEGGSWKQRVLVEYLKGIQSRAEEIVQFLQGNAQ